MARTLEQIVQEQLGAVMLQNARLLSELEAAQERLKGLDAEAAKAKEAPPD